MTFAVILLPWIREQKGAEVSRSFDGPLEVKQLPVLSFASSTGL